MLPAWAKLPAAEITRRDVRELVESVAERGAPIQANRLRALLHKTFACAVQQEIVEHNPVTGTPRPGVEQKRQRVLTDDEIRRFWTVTEPRECMSAAMSAFWRLRLVTAQRATEISRMDWEELDLSNRVWTIPPERSKNKLAHRVPLSDLALELIGEIRLAHSLLWFDCS